MKRTKLPYVAVRWEDAHSPLGPTEIVTLDEAKKYLKPVECETRGWVLAQDSVGIMLAGEWCGDNDYRNTTIILTPFIREILPIAEPRPRKARHAQTAAARPDPPVQPVDGAPPPK